MTKVVFYTLGCKANQYQTEVLKSQLINDRFQLGLYGEEADLYVINTCTVTETADRKSRQAIRRALRLGKKVIVTGCYAKLEKSLLSKLFPQIEILEPSSISRRPSTMIPHPSFIVPRIRANLMIQDGCEHFCSYCILPYVRGKVKSKPIEDVIAEAEELVDAGAREIILTGINLGTYQYQLSSVVHRLSFIENLYRIRLSSLEPMYLSKDLIDTIAKNPKVCHHLHLPLQSGDNEILKAMNRNYSREDYLELVNYIKRQIPDCAITTDIIVGFPGEGEKEFQNTVDLIHKVKFARLHVFPFSKRKGTAAYNFPAQVDQNTKKKRIEILSQLRAKYLKEFASQYLNQEVEILVEKKGEGLTSNYLRVVYSGSKSEVGTLKKVKFSKVFIDNDDEKSSVIFH